jgi:hypothetical protein
MVQSTLPRRTWLAFRRAQLVRQAKARFEKAVIDAAQLAHQRAPGAVQLAARESRHARDHGWRPPPKDLGYAPASRSDIKRREV